MLEGILVRMILYSIEQIRITTLLIYCKSRDGIGILLSNYSHVMSDSGIETTPISKYVMSHSWHFIGTNDVDILGMQVSIRRI